MEKSTTTVLNKLNQLKRVLMKKLLTLETLPERVKSPAIGRIFSPEIVPPKEIFGPSVAPKVTPVPVNISTRTPIIEEFITPVVVPSAAADYRVKESKESPSGRGLIHWLSLRPLKKKWKRF